MEMKYKILLYWQQLTDYQSTEAIQNKTRNENSENIKKDSSS